MVRARRRTGSKIRPMTVYAFWRPPPLGGRERRLGQRVRRQRQRHEANPRLELRITHDARDRGREQTQRHGQREGAACGDPHPEPHRPTQTPNIGVGKVDRDETREPGAESGQRQQAEQGKQREALGIPPDVVLAEDVREQGHDGEEGGLLNDRPD